MTVAWQACSACGTFDYLCGQWVSTRVCVIIMLVLLPDNQALTYYVAPPDLRYVLFAARRLCLTIT